MIRRPATRKPRRDSRGDWRLLRPSHLANANPSPLPAPGGGRKGQPNDIN